jgi:hypothetical protein
MDADGSAGGRRQGADDVEGARDPRIGHKGFGGGGSRSARSFRFSNDFENSIGSIGQKRQNARVQVQNTYSGSACVRRTAAPSNPTDYAANSNENRLA